MTNEKEVFDRLDETITAFEQLMTTFQQLVQAVVEATAPERQRAHEEHGAVYGKAHTNLIEWLDKVKESFPDI